MIMRVSVMDIFTFDFMRRAFLAGLLVAVICPVIGTFLVVRKQSLIGDGLGHIAFAGVCAGWLLDWQPVLSAAAFTTARMRQTKNAIAANL